MPPPCFRRTNVVPSSGFPNLHLLHNNIDFPRIIYVFNYFKNAYMVHGTHVVYNSQTIF